MLVVNDIRPALAAAAVLIACSCTRLQCCRHQTLPPLNPPCSNPHFPTTLARQVLRFMLGWLDGIMSRWYTEIGTDWKWWYYMIYFDSPSINPNGVGLIVPALFKAAISPSLFLIHYWLSEIKKNGFSLWFWVI